MDDSMIGLNSSCLRFINDLTYIYILFFYTTNKLLVLLRLY